MSTRRSVLLPVAAAAALAVVAPVHAAAPDSPGHAEAARLERLRQAEVVIVSGSADHMEQVMRRAQVRFVVVSPDELAEVPLHGQQVLMVNCTGQMPARSRERVRRFVTAGGFLYTTDHAVHYLLESIFPGFMRWNGRNSNGEIVPMQVSGERGLLKQLDRGGSPRWQLASGGMPFTVLDRQRVEVLMSSSQAAARYGSGALGVRFRVGDGQVIHVTGHFFTQPGQSPLVAAAGGAFEQLSANVVSEKRSDKPRLDGLYDTAPRREVTLQTAPAASAPPVEMPQGGAAAARPTAKVRVLERKGDYARVRDDQGNEGWAPASSF